MSTEISISRPIFFPPEGAPKVALAIVGVKKSIEKVPKSGRNAEYKYSYVEHTVLTAKVQDAMMNNKLVLSMREISRTIVSGILFMKFEFDAYCDDQAIVNIGAITASCRFEFRKGTHDDKAAAKVITAALKSFELALFKIPADVDDIERDRDDFVPPPEDAYPDRGNGSEPPPELNDEPSPDDEPLPLAFDVKAFRHALRSADTRQQANELWTRNTDALAGCSDQIYTMLLDDYRDRWDSAPPKLTS